MRNEECAPQCSRRFCFSIPHSALRLPHFWLILQQFLQPRRLVVLFLGLQRLEEHVVDFFVLQVDLQRVALDFERIAVAFGNDRRSVVTGLFEVCQLMERLPPDEADVLREALVRGVGEGMARARGRYGRVISEEDERTVALVGELLS